MTDLQDMREEAHQKDMREAAQRRRALTSLRAPGWITTYSGAVVWPLLGTGTFRIEDVAHHLARRSRFLGATGHRTPTAPGYSVAQHSVLMAEEHPETIGYCPPNIRLAKLLHDAAEAYLPDLPSPYKGDVWIRRPYGRFVSFREVEADLLAAILHGLGLEDVVTPATLQATAEADLRAVVKEAQDLCHGTADWPREVPVVDYMPSITIWEAHVAEARFLGAYKRLLWEIDRDSKLPSSGPVTVGDLLGNPG